MRFRQGRRPVSIIALATVAIGMRVNAPALCTAAEYQPTPGIYLPPNEQFPAVGLSIYRKSNHGVYVSVGTERSFIGAALSGASALVVIDYDPLTIRFAEINRALLAASVNRADYLNLRLTAASEVWRRRSEGLGAKDKETLSDPANWAFWNEKVRKNETAWNNAFGHFHTEPRSAGDPFFRANYLFDEGLYVHLSQLAKNSRISARLLDLRHEEDVRKFCENLRSKGLRLGIIDTSDVPNSSKDGIGIAAQYIKVISRYAAADSIFLNTAPTGAQGVRWSYFAFSNRNVRDRESMTIKRWYEIEIKKISSSTQPQALLDDPDAINH